MEAQKDVEIVEIDNEIQLHEVEDADEVITEEAAAEPTKGSNTAEKDGMCFDDLVLPTATITKLMGDVLPDKSLIAKDAKEIARRVATYFILYITDCVSEIASGKKRKTILPEDILSALKDSDFDDMIEILNNCLSKRKAKVPAAKKPIAANGKEVDEEVSNDIATEELVEHAEEDLILQSPVFNKLEGDYATGLMEDRGDDMIVVETYIPDASTIDDELVLNDHVLDFGV